MASAYRGWDEPALDVQRVQARNGALLRIEYHGKIGYAHDGYVVELLPDSPAGWPSDEELARLCNPLLFDSFGPGPVEPDGERRRRVSVPTD